MFVIVLVGVKWDKGMVPEFQRTLFDVIMAKYTGSKPRKMKLEVTRKRELLELSG